MKLCERMGWTLEYVRQLSEEEFQTICMLLSAENEAARLKSLQDGFYK